MTASTVQSAYETLCARVRRVGAIHRRCGVVEGAGRVTWRMGLPLLAIVVLQCAVGLPFYVRALVLPAVAVLGVWWPFVHVLRPWMARYSLTRSALLVEHARPELQTRVVSALETYADLSRVHAWFDPVLVRALVLHAQRSTEAEDFTSVIDRTASRRQALAGAVTLVLWAALLAHDAPGVSRAMGSMVGAWGEVRDVAQKLAGARIEVRPAQHRAGNGPWRSLDAGQAALVGDDVRLLAAQHGFHKDRMRVFLRAEGAEAWQSGELPVDPAGRAEHVLRNVRKSFEYYFEAGKVRSETLRVEVTERPRIVNIKVVYELPEYARSAPIVQEKGDGNLRALYGSTVVMTITANKPLRSVRLAPAGPAKVDFSRRFGVGGRYARGVLRIEAEPWRAAAAPETREQFTLTLTDAYGHTNADAASRRYELVVVKDLPPRVSFVGLPNRSSAHEPHLLEENLARVGLSVRAGDDVGVARVTVAYHLEDLETGRRRAGKSRVKQFEVPRSSLPRLHMLRLSETGARVGDRIAFRAEVEDAYDLGPDRRPHKAATPTYRIAVVTKEETFQEAVYRDDWSTQWYDSLKVATLTARQVPARTSPVREASQKVAAKLLDAPQAGEALGEEDRRLMEDYFDSLNVEE